MTALSIFIPSYNQARFLPESVGSAVVQTGVDQILVSDDKSTDSSLDLLRSYQRKETRLIVIDQARNLGIPGNIDAGLRACSGEFVLRLDADDRLLPNACARLHAALQLHPEAGVAHGQVWEINEQGVRKHRRMLARPHGFQAGRTALAESASGFRVAANILLFRRAALESVDYLQGRPSFAEDYHLFAALAAQGWGNVYLDEDIAEYRNYTNATRAARKSEELQGLLAVFDGVLEPAFKACGLPMGLLCAGRRRLADSQARYLLEADELTPEHEVELMVLLRSLNASPWPRIYLAARRAGLRPALLAVHRIKHTARRQLKALVLGARQALSTARP